MRSQKEPLKILFHYEQFQTECKILKVFLLNKNFLDIKSISVPALILEVPIG